MSLVTIQTKWLVLGALIILLVLGGAGFVGYNLWQAGRTAKTENKLSTNQTGAALDSGKDAVNTVGAANNREIGIDVRVKGVSDVIRSNPSSAGQLDPSLHNAGIDGLCGFAGYRSDPKCVQHAGAGQLAPAGGGSPAP
jgi:hypothetical protein